MNTFIETLNFWGESALSFVLPMLWQSSLLIAALFAIDFVLRRKVRAAVRYALWLVVLVKLLVPPSLASPTGLAWWLRTNEPAPVHEKRVRTFTVTYKDSVDAPTVVPVTAYIPPPTRLSGLSWIMLGWAAVGTSLLCWMLFRWRKVERDVQLAASMPEEMTDMFEEARKLAGLQRIARLRLTDRAMSPAVCGLFRPVILLPKTLVRQLQPVQLRAVLLHELIHLRRRDVWVNCAQTLLQIVYWWHPLLWLANARIRHVREEAVDDAVMLTLRDDAHSYAPTLVEVAKLAFNRPLASLGLVGILESRSALRQRIQRLINFHAPRKSGLTLISAIGILGFGATALPMGEAPRKMAAANSVGSGATAELIEHTGSPRAGAVIETNNAAAQREVINTNLHTRVFKVDPTVFIAGLMNVTGNAITNKADEPKVLTQFLHDAGVDFQPPKALFFNRAGGTLLVRATLADLDAVEQTVQLLNSVMPQVNIQVKFVELPEEAANAFYSEWFATDRPSDLSWTGILTQPQMKNLIQQLEGRDDVTIIAGPSVTTLSGRQAQIQMVDMKTIVNGLNTTETNGETKVVYQTQHVPFGPTLDVIPYVSADGNTIQLTAIPTITEFVGYDDPREFTTNYNKSNQHGELPLPRTRVRQITTSATVWDGQTLVLGNFSDRLLTKKPDGLAQSKPFADGKNMQLFVFVTSTIIDSYGNRVHSEKAATANSK